MSEHIWWLEAVDSLVSLFLAGFLFVFAYVSGGSGIAYIAIVIGILEVISAMVSACRAEEAVR